MYPTYKLLTQGHGNGIPKVIQDVSAAGAHNRYNDIF